MKDLATAYGSRTNPTQQGHILGLPQDRTCEGILHAMQNAEHKTVKQKVKGRLADMKPYAYYLTGQ